MSPFETLILVEGSRPESSRGVDLEAIHLSQLWQPFVALRARRTAEGADEIVHSLAILRHPFVPESSIQ